MKTLPIVLALALALLAGAVGFAPAARAKPNGLLAYTNVVDKGTPAERRAVFVYPGGQLTHPLAPDNDSTPAWSPDGKSIAFVRRIGTTGEYTIQVANSDGANQRKIGGWFQADGSWTSLFGHVVGGVSWSPDATTLAISTGCTSIVTRCFAALSLPITGPPYSSLPNYISDVVAGPDWSSDGLLHFCPSFSVPPNRKRLFCVYRDQATTHVTEIEKNPAEPATNGFTLSDIPRWSYGARGPRVFFGLGYERPAGGGTVGVWSIFSIKPALTAADNATGTEFIQLTADPGLVTCTNRSGDVTTLTYRPRYLYRQPFPSPDGKYFAVRRTEAQPQTNPPPANNCTFKETNAIYVLRNDGYGTVQNVVAVGDDVGAPAWQPSPANLEVTIDGGHEINGQRDELRGLKVELVRLDTGAVFDRSATNPSGGQYLFEDVPAGSYGLKVTLTDAEAQAFDIRHEYPAAEPVWAQFELKVPEGAESVSLRYAFNESDPRLLVASPSDRYDRLDDMAAIYFQVRRYVDWVKGNLTADTGENVEFYSFATVDSRGKALSGQDGWYLRSVSAVFMAPGFADYQERDGTLGDGSPLNGEWHEFTHHIDYNNRTLDESTCADPNHGGYANPTTCDSLIEGIASWVPTMVAGDPDYAGITNHEAQTKAWGIRIKANGDIRSMEELAVAALLWDLVDDTPDAEFTLAIGAGGGHFAPAIYSDDVSLPLATLWGLLGSEKPETVSDLQQVLNQRAGALTIDLDNDNQMDVNIYDPIFLMHGFFPIAADQRITGTHTTYHFNVVGARESGLSPNARVGRSDHEGFTSGNFASGTFATRGRLEASEIAKVGIQVRDASGTPLEGAELILDLHYPGFDQPVVRRIPRGEGDLVHLELPTYFDYLPEGDALPACNFDTDLYVSVTVRARLNGYFSTNSEGFDNCQYLQAVLASTGPAALAYTLTFPEDSTDPITGAQTYGQGVISGSNATESWGVELSCSDPAAGGFASGCTRTEYRLNGGPITRYFEPFLITAVGRYTLEYRSADAAANQEPFRSIQLSVGLPPPSISGFSPSSGGAGTVVTVTGANFTGTTAVSFNGASAVFSVGSTGEITTTVPVGATSGPIELTTPGGTVTSNASFTVVPPPTITGFSPAFGGVGSTVTVTGTNLDGATTVRFNGANAVFLLDSSTQLRATVPAAASSGAISVTTLSGAVASGESFVVTVGAAPSITSVLPTSGATGASVTIKGANLSGLTSVTFNGVSAGFRLKGGAISATVPAGATTGPIRVTTPGGWATSAVAFTVIPPPSITGFAPASGPANSVVTIAGTSLSGATSVRFGGISATFTVVSATTISAVVPRRANTGPISATTPGGTATSSGSFTVTR